jgi:hypothetical protein
VDALAAVRVPVAQLAVASATAPVTVILLSLMMHQLVLQQRLEAPESAAMPVAQQHATLDRLQPQLTGTTAPCHKL